MNPWSIAEAFWKALPGLIFLGLFALIFLFVPESRPAIGFIGGTILTVAVWVLVGAWLGDKADDWRHR